MNHNIKTPILLLGATGNIGSICLEAIKKSGISLLGVSFYNNLDLMLEIIQKYKPLHVFSLNESCKERFPSNMFPHTKIHFGKQSLEEFLIHYDESDFRVINAIAGIEGLKSSELVLKRNKTLILANKESLLLGSSLFTDLVQRENQLIPIDSEHFSLFFLLSLLKEKVTHIRKMIITASGGPFLNVPPLKLKKITRKEALAHPIWNHMGENITISSATLANKGLEVMEAKELFKIPISSIDVLIHPQSLCHAMVKLSNGSYLSHIYEPHMRFPIIHALHFPHIPNDSHLYDPEKEYSFPPIHEYQNVNMEQFPMLSLAYEAAQYHYSQIIYTVTNDFANRSFLEGKIKFLDIYSFVHYILSLMPIRKFNNILDVIIYIEEIKLIIQSKIKEFYS